MLYKTPSWTAFYSFYGEIIWKTYDLDNPLKSNGFKTAPNMDRAAPKMLPQKCQANYKILNGAPKAAEVPKAIEIWTFLASFRFAGTSRSQFL